MQNDVTPQEIQDARNAAPIVMPLPGDENSRRPNRGRPGRGESGPGRFGELIPAVFSAKA